MTVKDKELTQKIISSLIGFLCTVSLAIGSFALKEGYSAKLEIKELGVRILEVEKHVDKLDDLPSEIAVTNQRLMRLESDISEIKKDVKEILQKEAK